MNFIMKMVGILMACRGWISQLFVRRAKQVETVIKNKSLPSEVVKNKPNRFLKRAVWRSLSCKERECIKHKCNYKGFKEYKKHIL